MRANEKISTNKHKGKGFRSSLFPERLAGVQRAEDEIFLLKIINMIEQFNAHSYKIAHLLTQE